MNGKADFIANFWEAVKEFQYRYPGMHKVLAVCDADDEPANELEAFLTRRAEEKLQSLPFPLMFHVIKRELETWWVAEPHSITLETGVEIPFPGGNVEEDLVDPKEYLSRRLGARNITYTRRIASKAAENLNLATISARCPGFVVFAQKVEDGEGMARASGRPLRRIVL
ncbi:MAG: hypothetical protein HY725_04875 [Candidatus Rokubacteria bacterium]|nr:hypothetical protein [Candidatus Rokubacteria bacterium]